MLCCSLWRPPNVHADCQISQQAQGQDYFHSVSTSHVPQPAQSTLVFVRFSISLFHSALEIFPMCERWEAYLYTQHWGRWCEMGTSEHPLRGKTALIAYSWFSTVDEALFQPSPQKSVILWLSFCLFLPIMGCGQIRPYSQICVLQKQMYAVEPSI